MSFLGAIKKAAEQTVPGLGALDSVGQAAKDVQKIAGPHGKNLVIQQAAQSVGISPQTLYGVWTEESGRGTNDGPSSAGAVGDFQFMPGTARSLGINPLDFHQAAYGAARYLKQLGADSKPDSGATILALQKYNAGPAAPQNADPSYVPNVLKYGKGFGTDLLGKFPVIGGALDSAENAVTDTAGFIAKVTSPTGLGQLVASATAVFFRFFFQALWKYAIAPPWHRTQKATVFYAESVLDGKRMGVADDRYKWALPATLAFWAFGWTALFSRTEEGYSPLSSARRTPLGKSIRKGQGLAARRKLIKAKHVKSKTPKKPKVHVSRARVHVVRHMSVNRPRAVTVQERGTKNDTPTSPASGFARATAETISGEAETIGQTSDRSPSASNGKARDDSQSASSVNANEPTGTGGE